MADVLDVVTLDAAGAPVQVLNLNDLVTYNVVANSFTIAPGQKQQAFSSADRRYGGAKQTSETTDNGQVAWTILVRGDDADDVIAAISTALAVLERIPRSLWIRWVPDGSSELTLMEIRSTATWTPTYQWQQFHGANSMAVQVSWQVAPLARGRRVTITPSEATLPAVVPLPASIPGDAPALADITITTGDGTGNPVGFALIGWAARPPSGLAAAPFGVLNAVDAGNVAGWAYDRTNLDLRTASAASGTRYTASWTVDPARLVADDFDDTVAVEVWGHVLLDVAAVTPTIVLSARPEDGLSFGSARYTEEWGASGRTMTRPTATAWRWTRLGTLRLTVDSLRPRRWLLWIDAAVGPGSSGFFAVRRLLAVPAQSRACSPSGVPGDSTYPVFISSSAATEKTIRSDLSAVIGRPGLNGHPDHGLGGELLELPPGDVDLVAALNWLVPDDTRALTASDAPSAVRRARLSLSITPRYHLLAGS